MKKHLSTLFAAACIGSLCAGCSSWSFMNAYDNLQVRQISYGTTYSIKCSNLRNFDSDGLSFASDLCRYRAAQISRENGAPYFSVDDINRFDAAPALLRLYNGKTYEEHLAEDRLKNPNQKKGGEYERECRVRKSLQFMAYSEVKVTRWVSLTMTITCHKTPPTSGYCDAQSIINEMRQRYNLD